jgi:hypothetical protein
LGIPLKKGEEAGDKDKDDKKKKEEEKKKKEEEKRKEEEKKKEKEGEKEEGEKEEKKKKMKFVIKDKSLEEIDEIVSSRMHHLIVTKYEKDNFEDFDLKKFFYQGILKIKNRKKFKSKSTNLLFYF